ncbi:MAG TPA: hypothetical protein VFC19_28715 [Candidatus Limnocylindrales bacterium]|nr:hypothetical protein [Candidatus Limnocylindrales bacterium]
MGEIYVPKPPVPGGIHLSIGTAAVVAVAFGAAAFTDHGSVERLLVMALAAGIGAALIPDWRYGATLGVITYLLYLGFLVNSYGELSWNYDRSLWDLIIFTMGFLLGLAQRWMRAERKVARGEHPVSEVEITTSSK